MRWIGHRLHADAELDIDPTTRLTDAHQIAHDAEHTLTHAVPKLSSALIHASGDLRDTLYPLSARLRPRAGLLRLRRAGLVTILIGPTQVGLEVDGARNRHSVTHSALGGIDGLGHLLAGGRRVHRDLGGDQ